MNPTDHDLLLLYLQRGDKQALASLLDRYYGLIQSVCRSKLANRDLAEDAAQAVVLLFLRQARKLQGHKCLGGWFVETARKVCLNARRGEKRREVMLDTYQKAVDREQESGKGEGDPSVWATLENLPAEDRNLLILRHYEGRTHGEIAEILGVSEDAARMRCSRAEDRARERATKLGFGTAGVALLGALTQAKTEPVPTGWAAGGTSASGLAIGLASAVTKAMVIKQLAVGGLAVAGLLFGGILVAQSAGMGGKPVVKIQPEDTKFFQHVVGDYSGTLTYENFSDGKMMEEQVEARVAWSDTRDALEVSFRYPAYPGAQYDSSSKLVIDRGSGLAQVGEEVFRAEGVEEFSQNGSGTIVMNGQVTEEINGKLTRVPARTTIMVEGSEVVIRRETRSPLKLRNEYRLARIPQT